MIVLSSAHICRTDATKLSSYLKRSFISLDNIYLFSTRKYINPKENILGIEAVEEIDAKEVFNLLGI